MPSTLPHERVRLVINGERVPLRSFRARDVGRTGEPTKGPGGDKGEATFTLLVDPEEAERLATWDHILP